jgi:hypothetical protein
MLALKALAKSSLLSVMVFIKSGGLTGIFMGNSILLNI